MSVEQASDFGPCVGIDIGGSKIRMLVADIATPSMGTDIEIATHSEKVVTQVCDLVSAHGGAQAASIAIGVPGIVDPHTLAISQVPFAAGLEGESLKRASRNASSGHRSSRTM